MRTRRFFRINATQTMAVLAVTFAACTTLARAEVQKFVNPCGQKLCAYYQIALTPPDGWVLDAKATKDNKIQIVVPKGQVFASAHPRSSAHGGDRAADQPPPAVFARTSVRRRIA